jgi:excisionase family DNA binding protein
MDDWITTQEAAELSGYHPTYLRLLIREGHIPARKFGPLWQVSRKGLQDYLKAAEQSGDKRRGPKP